MRWFSKESFNEVRKLIDAGNAYGVKEWYWNNYRGNATTLVLAFVYAVMNGKDATCIKRMKGILNPPDGKKGPAVWSDVATEIYNHDSAKAVKTMEILVDEGIQFEVKNGDVIKEFMTNPKFKKIADAIDKNPNLISSRLRKDEVDKTLTTLLQSSNYDVVKKALEPYAWEANKSASTTGRNSRNSGYQRNRNYTPRKSVTTTDLLKKTAMIADDKIRTRYIKEVVFVSKTAYVEDLFGELHSIMKTTTMSGSDVVDILKGLGPSNKGTYSATKLLYEIHQRGDKKSVEEISKNWPTNLWDGVLDDVRYYNAGKASSAHPEYTPDWLKDYFDFIGMEKLVKLLSKIDVLSDDFVKDILQKYSGAMKLILDLCPEKLPKTISDIFIF